MFSHANQGRLDVIVCARRIEIRLGNQIINEACIVLQHDTIAACHPTASQLVHIAVDQAELPGQCATSCSEWWLNGVRQCIVLGGSEQVQFRFDDFHVRRVGHFRNLFWLQLSEIISALACLRELFNAKTPRKKLKTNWELAS